MDIIIGILAFVFVLGIIIAVHEGGHFFFARRVDILCREYAFGMGPMLLKTKKGETVYSIRAFPIGGFCAIAGEELEDDLFKDINKIKLHVENNVIKGFYLNYEDESIDYPVYEILSYDIYDANQTGNLYMNVFSKGEDIRFSVDPQAMIYDKKIEMQIAPYNRTIGSKSLGARAMVMFGGPLMNFLLALVVFFIAGLIQGFPNYETSKLAGMKENEPTPAYAAGLRNDDVITSLSSGITNIQVNEWKDISDFMEQYFTLGNAKPIIVTYERDGVSKTATVEPQVMFSSLNFIGEFLYLNGVAQGIKVTLIGELDNEMATNKQLLKDDVIIKINSIPFSQLSIMYKEISNYEGNAKEDLVEMTVLRNGIEETIKVRPYSKGIMDTQTTIQGDKIPIIKILIGVGPSYKFSLGQSFAYSGTRTLGSFTAVFDTLGLLFGKESVSISSLSGPVGIFDMTSTIASQGFANLLNWMGLLSVNVGLLNLFPIPALDGGRLVFLGYEAITKKKPSQKVETALISITMILLLGLMLFVTFNDILRLFK